MVSDFTNGTHGNMAANAEPYVTDVCIIGTGPAGGSLASFLGHYGVRGIMVGKTNSTATSPRAHITNIATLECLRDIGLEEEARKAGLDKSFMRYCHWCENMAGKEIARAPSWGNGALAEAEYKAASPCEPLDLAQTLLEPILYRKAVNSGFVCRFNTSFVSFKEDPDKGIVDVVVKDLVFGTEHVIRYKYLCGGDGAGSKVLGQLGLPLKQGEGQGTGVVNLLLKADLSRHMKYREGNLHWFFQEDDLNEGLVWVVHPRMVTPWKEWVVGFFVAPGSQPKTETPACDGTRA
ncbi:FAD-binding monooxygenase [Leptodontidium sp. 2 PMI_412]|nr:FAD-binding monooxygenase [Leptodontidium sp. 2 PMI_412]